MGREQAKTKVTMPGQNVQSWRGFKPEMESSTKKFVKKKIKNQWNDAFEMTSVMFYAMPQFHR